ncbi:MAG: hypothetical protein ACUVRS_03955 [Armatimonadota bacterium]
MHKQQEYLTREDTQRYVSTAVVSITTKVASFKSLETIELELLRECQLGNTSSLEKIYDRLGKMGLEIVLSHGRKHSIDDAQDLGQ